MYNVECVTDAFEELAGQAQLQRSNTRVFTTGLSFLSCQKVCLDLGSMQPSQPLHGMISHRSGILHPIGNEKSGKLVRLTCTSVLLVGFLLYRPVIGEPRLLE